MISPMAWVPSARSHLLVGLRSSPTLASASCPRISRLEHQLPRVTLASRSSHPAIPEEKKKKLAAELANGRLAMMAIIGMFFQDGLTGSQKGRCIKQKHKTSSAELSSQGCTLKKSWTTSAYQTLKMLSEGFAFSFCLAQERICSKRERALGIV